MIWNELPYGKSKTYVGIKVKVREDRSLFQYLPQELVVASGDASGVGVGQLTCSTVLQRLFASCANNP